MKSSFKYYWILVFVSLSVVTANSQDTTYVDVLDFFETNRVHWVDQIPPYQEDVKKQKKGWFKRLVLGKNEITTFQKPVHVIATSPETSIVLDQGNGTLFFTDEGELEIPKILKKKEAYFSSLVSACLLPNRDLLFTDSRDNKIYFLSEDQKTLGVFNEALELSQPTGIAYSSLKNEIWVVETAAHQIAILDAQGARIRTIGTRGTGEGEFNFPTSIWIDEKGMVFIVDAINYRIQIFDVEGNFISMFGENGNGTGYLARPKGIATDSYGHIYVVDALFHGVQIFDVQGNYLYHFGTQGRQTEEFWMPSGIFIDKTNHIYVADSYNSRIQVFELIYTE